MSKLRLMVVAAIALSSVLLMTQTQVEANDQIEQLKSQFLPAQFQNTNFTAGMF